MPCNSRGFPGSAAGKESACNAGDPGFIHGLERSPGESIGYPLQYSWACLVAQSVKKSACNAGNLGLIPGKIPWRREWQPTPENSMDRGAWWATVHGVAKSWTRLRDFHFSPSPLTVRPLEVWGAARKSRFSQNSPEGFWCS